MAPSDDVLVDYGDSEYSQYESHPAYATALAGATAAYLKTQGVGLGSPAELYDAMTQLAKQGQVQNVPEGVDNLLLYNGIFE